MGHLVGAHWKPCARCARTGLNGIRTSKKCKVTSTTNQATNGDTQLCGWVLLVPAFGSIWARVCAHSIREHLHRKDGPLVTVICTALQRNRTNYFRAVQCRRPEEGSERKLLLSPTTIVRIQRLAATIYLAASLNEAASSPVYLVKGADLHAADELTAYASVINVHEDLYTSYLVERFWYQLGS